MPTRVYIGDLGDQGSRAEIQRQFERYGNVIETWVARNPPGFAFVFFESRRDAEDAVKEMDGSMICGVRVRCEIAKGPDKGEKQRSGPKCYECGRVGHATRECTRRPGYVFRGRNSTFQSRRSGVSDRRRYSRSRSRSREMDNERYRRRSRSRSGSPRYRQRSSRSVERRRSHSRSRSIERKRSRSRSKDRRSTSRGRRSPYKEEDRQRGYNDGSM